MNEYLIEHKIKTVARLCKLKNGQAHPIILDSVEFSQWDFSLAEGCKGDAWIAIGRENANNYQDAIVNFRKKLAKNVPKIAFVSQCYMEFIQESFLMLRVNNNSERLAFVHWLSPRGATGLVFDEKEEDNLGKINLENKEFFWYMNDCYNTTGYTAKLLLMFAALESLAGKIVKVDDEGKEYETYDKKNMLAILGGDLFHKLYGQGGMRHKLSHGEYLDPSYSGTNYVEEIHKSILIYFNKNFDTDLNTTVVNPQRHPFGNAYYSNIFLKPKNNVGQNPSLKSVLDEFDVTDPVETQSSHSYEFVFGDDLAKKY